MPITARQVLRASVTSTDASIGTWNQIDPGHFDEGSSRHLESRIATRACPTVDRCDPSVLTPARFKVATLAGDNSWVAGVELAIASEPPARRPRIWGRRPPGVDPSHPEL